MDTNMAKDFDRIHKSVRWPYTYDNTDYLWRTRLTVRPQDFHSWNSSSILLCATNKKVEILFQPLENLRGSETDRNSRNMDVQKSFEAHNLKIVGFDSHTRY